MPHPVISPRLATLPYTAANPRSAIARLPVGLRTAALNKLSANANAPGGSKKQYARANQAAARNLRNALGIYLIETNFTAARAANVGGATPATISVENGTPGSTDVATNELDPVTWAAAGTPSMTVQVGTELAGNAKVTVV
jgi:phenylpyruvate tautomerase PptA (4-oxalocrotonate tautomerase family)